MLNTIRLIPSIPTNLSPFCNLAWRRLFSKTSSSHRVNRQSWNAIRFFAATNFNSFFKQYKGKVSIGFCFGATASYCLYSYYSHSNSVSFLQVNAAEKVDENVKVSARKTMNFIVDIVEKVAPSVVLIETKGTQHTMFGPAIFQGNGSGFIVRSDGLILTNAHVVQRAKRVKVQMLDGHVYEGEVEYFDSTSDLAAVKINATNLPYLKLANSKEAKAGEIVIALGCPMSLSNSVTFGIISNTQRRLPDMPFSYIQTDAAITTGNSGGPLVNLDGEVVGINSMTVMNAAGLSFAIPSDYARIFLEKVYKASGQQTTGGGLLTTPGKRKHLGITMFSLDNNVLNELKMRNKNFPKVEHGILVHTIQVQSPAHKGGIQPGDVIVEVDGKPIYSSDEFMKIIQNSTGALNITVVRLYQTLKLTVVPEVERD